MPPGIKEIGNERSAIGYHGIRITAGAEGAGVIAIGMPEIVLHALNGSLGDLGAAGIV